MGVQKHLQTNLAVFSGNSGKYASTVENDNIFNHLFPLSFQLSTCDMRVIWYFVYHCDYTFSVLSKQNDKDSPQSLSLLIRRCVDTSGHAVACHGMLTRFEYTTGLTDA